MLRVTGIHWNQKPSDNDTGDILLLKNPAIQLTVVAPIFWWKDSNFNYSPLELTTSKKWNDFCLDEWELNEPIIQGLILKLMKLCGSKTDLRKTLEILPMGTMVEGNISLDYSDIVDYCKDYLDGSLLNCEVLPTSREWTDFCETLLDIRGVREITEGGNRNAE